MNAPMTRLARYLLARLCPARDDAVMRSILIWHNEQKRAGRDDVRTKQRQQDQSARTCDPSLRLAENANISPPGLEYMPDLTRLILVLRIHDAMQTDAIAQTFLFRPRYVCRNLRHAVAIIAPQKALSP